MASIVCRRMVRIRLSVSRFTKTALLLALTAPAGGASLREEILARTAAFAGDLSLYAKNLDSGEAIGLREDAPVRTASTIKLPVLAALFDAVARGEAKWDERLTVTEAEKVAGSGVIASEISAGVQLPLRDAANLMIVVSDNTATNMIFERFSPDRVNEFLDRIGLPGTRALRKIRGDGSRLKQSKAGRLPENEKYGLGVSTAREMAEMLERLERGSLVNAAASREMLAILKRCQDDSGIARRLGGIAVANKTGTLDALRSDVGIVYSKGGRIAMAITVDGMAGRDYSPDNPGSLLIADLAKMIVDGLAKR